MNHLSLFVVGGGHIFVGYIAVLSEGVKCRIEVLCCGEKIASAGVIEIGLQPLFDILCLDDLNDLLSLDNVPVGGIHAETIYRLIAVVVCDAERPHKRIMDSRSHRTALHLWNSSRHNAGYKLSEVSDHGTFRPNPDSST